MHKVLKEQEPAKRPFVVSRSSFAGHGRGEPSFRFTMRKLANELDQYLHIGDFTTLLPNGAGHR